MAQKESLENRLADFELVCGDEVKKSKWARRAARRGRRAAGAARVAAAFLDWAWFLFSVDGSFSRSLGLHSEGDVLEGCAQPKKCALKRARQHAFLRCLVQPSEHLLQTKD